MQRRSFIRATGATAAALASLAFSRRMALMHQCASWSAFPPGGAHDALARVVAQKLTVM